MYIYIKKSKKLNKNVYILIRPPKIEKKICSCCKRYYLFSLFYSLVEKSVPVCIIKPSLCLFDAL